MVGQLDEKDMGIAIFMCRPTLELQDRIKKGSLEIFNAIGDPLDEKLDNLWLIYECAEKALIKLN
jgi:hypothetical protein